MPPPPTCLGDDFSRIAMAGDSMGSGVGSITHHRPLDPLLFWRAALHINQPYCRLHFLRECSLYHLCENNRYKSVNDKLSGSTKSSKWPAAPTRVQPARRAREKNQKDQSATSSRTSSPAPSNTSKDYASLGAHHEQLQHHLPWPVYKNRLEDHVTQISEKLSHHQQKDDSEFYQHCSLGSRRPLDCRYCTSKPEVIDDQSSAPRKLAVPAPMDLIQPNEMREEQMNEFGGITFAVDVCGEKETIVLLGMKGFDNFAGEPAADSGIAITKKRDYLTLPVEANEETSVRQNKKRKTG